ncbi:MAG: phosphotransferase family protein [Dehalococcoidia bacterium]
MVTRDVYLQPDVPDPVLEEAVVLALARRHVPEARAVTVVDESGGEARAYAVDDTLIVKTQRPHRLRPRTSLAKEVFFLTQLAADPSLAVPRVLGYGQEGPVEYICMTRVPGIALRQAPLLPAQRAAILNELGCALRRIHALPQPPLLASGLFPGDHAHEDLVRRLHTAFDVVVEALQAVPEAWPLKESPEAIGRRALAALPTTTHFVALHSNPGPEHLFIDPRTGAFSGLIDFGDAYISHPALDLRPWRDRRDREALLTGYFEGAEPDAGFKAMVRVSALLGELGAIARRRQSREQAAVNLRELLGSL